MYISYSLSINNIPVIFQLTHISCIFQRGKLKREGLEDLIEKDMYEKDEIFRARSIVLLKIKIF